MTSPIPTMIDTIAIRTGMSPATTAPKTSSRIRRAAGSPNSSSPLFRSLCERAPKSFPAASEPVTATWNPGVVFRVIATTGLIAVLLPTRIGTRTAWRSAETTGGVTMFSTVPVACSSLRSRVTNAWNCGLSAAYRSEVTITSSLCRCRRSAGLGGNAAAIAASARADSGFPVTVESEVSP